MADVNELLESLTTVTRINLEDDDISLIHPRYLHYKTRRPLNQEDRRKKWLLEQKEKRLDSLLVSRGIDVEQGTSDAEPHSKGEKRRPTQNPYRHRLMRSIWLVDVPEDLNTDWYYLLCPQGKRALVVATKGSTVAYTRRGVPMRRFASALPGGSSDCYPGETILDCIYNYDTQVFYVLDVLLWGVSLVDSSAEMRFFWLSSKFAEYPQLRERTSKNQHEFCLLQHDLTASLGKTIVNHPIFENNRPPLEGVLFFQKDGLYERGKSPLTVWLKPFMVRDVLGLPVHESYISEMPAKYCQMETEAASAT